MDLDLHDLASNARENVREFLADMSKETGLPAAALVAIAGGLLTFTSIAGVFALSSPSRPAESSSVTIAVPPTRVATGSDKRQPFLPQPKPEVWIPMAAFADATPAAPQSVGQAAPRRRAIPASRGPDTSRIFADLPEPSANAGPLGRGTGEGARPVFSLTYDPGTPDPKSGSKGDVSAAFTPVRPGS